MKCQAEVSHTPGLTFPFFAPEQYAELRNKEHSTGIFVVWSWKGGPLFPTAARLKGTDIKAGTSTVHTTNEAKL
jgi:hypothetical protein